MELNEIVVEGLRGFSQMTRIPLATGLTLIHPVDERGAVVRAVVLELLYPSGTDAEDSVLARLADPAAHACRVGLIVVGRDGQRFRLLKDIRTGRTSLLRQAAGGALEPVSSSGPEIAQMVTAQIGFPQADVMREVFLTGRADLPSQRSDAMQTGVVEAGAEASSSGPDQNVPLSAREPASKGGWNKPLPPGFAEAMGAGPDFSHLDDDGKQRKLEELRTQLNNLDQLKDMEFELDGLQKKAFALDERLRPLDSLKGQLRSAEVALERLADAADLPTDLPEQRRDFLLRKAEHEGELRTLDERRSSIDEKLQMELARAGDAKGLVQAALGQNLIKYGLAAGMLGLVIGAVGFAVFEPLRWVALVDIPAFGVALYGAMQFLADAEGAAVLRGQLDRIERERTRHVDRFELENTRFRAILKRFDLDIDSAESVDEKIAAFTQARHAAEAARAAIGEAIGDDDLASLEQERAELSERIKDLEAKLYEAGGFGGNKADLTAQIEQLEDALSGAPPKPVEPVVEEISSPQPAAPPVDVGPVESTRAVERLVSDASDLLVASLDQTCTTLAPRVAQYLSGMSDRRFAQMVFGPRGEVSVVDGASGRAIPFGMLTPGDRDVVFLSLKMTVVEIGVRAGRIPVFLDRAFESFPEIKHPLLVRMIQFLAQHTQVVLMTDIPAMAAAGGHRVALPPLV